MSYDEKLASHIIDEQAVEIERLRAILKEIAGDPTGISTFQADLAKEALGRDPVAPITEDEKRR